VALGGPRGENAPQTPARGRPAARAGRLGGRGWRNKEGNNRQSVEIVADNIQFLGGREEGMGGGGGGFTPRSDIPVDTSDYAATPVANRAPASSPAPPSDDDIPL